jgi:hypothetical protein
MNKSLHYQKILKRVTIRLWNTLSNRDRDIIAGDIDRDTNTAKWFDSTVTAEAKSKYESPTYWFNDPYSFRVSER